MSNISIKPSNGGTYQMTNSDKKRYADYMAQYKDASWAEQFSAMLRIKTMILNDWTDSEYAEVCA